MNLRQMAMVGVVAGAMAGASVPAASAQSTPETFTGTATIKTAGAAAASAPITIVVSRKLSQSEADSLTSAFKTGGAPALRKALAAVAPTGTVRLGQGEPTSTRLTIERPTDKGRLLTIVTEQPLLFLGAGMPKAKSKEGYEFGIIDIEVDAAGSGSGTLAPAAKVSVRQGAFVVDDYAAEVVQLVGVKKVK
jgi:hypothetical protein